MISDTSSVVLGYKTQNGRSSGLARCEDQSEVACPSRSASRVLTLSLPRILTKSAQAADMFSSLVLCFGSLVFESFSVDVGSASLGQ